MNARRGACPALSAPMPTGDGLLVRLNPTASGLSPNTLIGLCESAAHHGNGIVEVTARGSFQIRGLTAASASRLADDVNTLGISVRTGVPVETGPLAGLDPDEIADPRPLTDALRATIADAGLSARLGPKVSVVVDGGGHSGLDAVLADIRLTATGTGWRLATAGDARSAREVGDYEEAAAVEAALSVLEAIATLGIEARAKHLADLGRLRSTLPPSVLPDISPSRGEISSFNFNETSARLVTGETEDESRSPPLRGRWPAGQRGVGDDRTPTINIGHPLLLRDSRHAVPLALPYGSIEAKTLATFLSDAEAAGAEEIRLAPRRTLLALTSSADATTAILALAAAHGLITSPTDPRLFIAACPGAPACASGKLATRALAANMASASLLDGSFTLHISGCAKGCAHTGPTALTLVGGENGAGLVADGTAGHTPLAYTRTERLPAALARLAAQRAPGETAKTCLARLGPARIAAMIEG